MRLASAVPFLGLLIAGCSDDTPTKATPSTPTTTKQAWIGTYASGLGAGDVILDITQTGSSLAGEVVIGPTAATYVPIAGVMSSDSMFLTLDPAVGNPALFSLRLQVRSDTTCSGTMTVASAGMTADVSCRPLPRRTVDTDEIHEIPSAVITMVYDGSLIWLTTTSDYLRIQPDGTTVDHVVIPHEPAAVWTSSELMYDGTVIWGVYPITIMGPGGSTNVADLLGFTALGRTPDSIRVDHRPHGMAYDGTRYWSLRNQPGALTSFDRTGAITDSLHVGIPDGSDLGFDGSRFWVLGFMLERLYEVSTAGEVVAICDLPSTGPSFPIGLATEGQHIWFGEGRIGSTTLHRMTLR